MMTSSMGRSNQRLPLAWPMSIMSALTTQVRLSLADACVMMLPLSSPSCPSRRLGGLWPPGSGCRRAQNGNGRRSQKSEHVLRCGISRATTLPSADGADDGRCGQEVVHQKVGHITRPGPLAPSTRLAAARAVSRLSTRFRSASTLSLSASSSAGAAATDPAAAAASPGIGGSGTGVA